MDMAGLNNDTAPDRNGAYNKDGVMADGRKEDVSSLKESVSVVVLDENKQQLFTGKVRPDITAIHLLGLPELRFYGTRTLEMSKRLVLKEWLYQCGL